MHQVPKYVPKIRLINRDGHVWEYKNLTEAANDLYGIFGWNIREQIGDQWVKSRNWDCRIDTPYYYYYTYILQTDLGESVTVDELMNARSDTGTWYNRYWSRHHPHVFRCGPVPNISSRRYRSGYRHMGTTQEICEADALRFDEDAQDYGIKARAKRNRSNLPGAWDDYWRPCGQKNWKHYRKTQWKNKK